MQYNKQVIFDDFRDCYVIICYVINEWRNYQIVDHSRLFRWRKIGKGLFEINEHWNFKKNENYCWGLRSIGPTPWNSLICTVFLPHRYIYMLKYTYFPIHIDKAYSKKIWNFRKIWKLMMCFVIPAGDNPWYQCCNTSFSKRFQSHVKTQPSCQIGNFSKYFQKWDFCRFSVVYL